MTLNAAVAANLDKANLVHNLFTTFSEREQWFDLDLLPVSSSVDKRFDGARALYNARVKAAR